ncbi:MAG: MATE family efflux transporter [Monoglobales bacterium]
MKTLSATTSSLYKLAIPCILEQLLIVSSGVLASMVMGHVGKNELTGVAMVNTLVTWLQFLFLGLGTGVTVVIGRLYGEENHEGVKDATMQSIYLAFYISIALVFLCFTFSDQLLGLFFSNADPEVMKHIKIYFPYSIVSVPFVAVNHTLNAAARGVGDNSAALVSNSIVNFLYALLAYILIFGIRYFGYPSLSTTGTGIAVLIARIVGPFCAIILVYARKIPIFPKKIFAKSKEGYIRRIFGICTYSAIEQAVFQGGFVILQSMLLIFGATIQAGYQIASTINNIFLAVVSGIAVAMTVLTSQSLARRNFDMASEIFSIAKKMFLLLLIPLGIVMFLSSPYLARVFSSEPDVISSTTTFARVLGACFCFTAYQTITCGILRGAGDARYITVSCTVGLWVGRLLPVYILSKYTSAYFAVGAGLVLDFATRSLMYHLRLRKGAWIHIKV